MMKTKVNLKTDSMTGDMKKANKHKSAKELLNIFKKVEWLGEYNPKVGAYDFKEIPVKELVDFLKKNFVRVVAVNPRGWVLSKYYDKEFWAYQVKIPTKGIPCIHIFRKDENLYLETVNE